MLGWPFLVARGRHTDYRTVSAPDFLVQANAYGVLSDHVRRADMRDGDVRSVAIDSPAGALTATYTSERLEGIDPSSTAGGPWPTDEHGRPLQILYGVVTRDGLNGGLDALDLGEARRHAIAGFRRFLADEPRFTVDGTLALQLRGVAPRSSASPASMPLPGSVSAPPTPPPPAPVRRSSRGSTGRRIGAGGAAIVAVTAALFALLHDPKVTPPPDPIVTVAIQPQPQPQPPTPDRGNCDAPMVLAANVTVDRATTLRYHWESPPGVEAGPRGRLTFTSAGTRQIHRAVDPPPVSSAGARRGRIAYVVVIDTPVKVKARPALRLTCQRELARRRNASAPE